MEDLSSNIQDIRNQIIDLEADKSKLIENNLAGEKDVDIAIIDCEIMELETKMNSKIALYNELYQCSCEHVFVDDLIDIDLDRSAVIKYCVLCLFTDEK